MNSIELFSGIGGLGIGVQNAGFKNVLAIEKDRKCVETIQFNKNQGVEQIRDWPILHQDINDYCFKRYENKISLVSGGPPCQPFSVGGKHNADIDSRDMFPEAIRAIREIKPRAFIFENVRGLTRYSFSNYFEYIRLQLTYPGMVKKCAESWLEHSSRLERRFTKRDDFDLSYNVLVKVLNAADYGVPQKRERVFFVGFRSDIETEWAFPAPTHSHSALIWSKKNGNYWDKNRVPKRERIIEANQLKLSRKSTSEPITLPWNTLRSAISDLPDPQRHTIKSQGFHNHKYQPGAKIYKGHTGSVLDEPSKTLKAGSHGVPGGENMVRGHDGSVRYFTIRESARLQGFPDEFSFECSWGESMKQLGNAVPIDLATILTKSIKNNFITK
jgi:DNA (cytosine-5)-methyltransferase 1